MNQEKIGKFIKHLRKKNNLTQKELADKYNVTYQAVSKWENGKNMPDISLLKEMSKDFGITLEEMLAGEVKKKTSYKKYIFISISFILLSIILIVIFSINNNDFKFKEISTTCDNFNISGSISYNDNKSAIYITNIKYCGKQDNNVYKKIECTLYESLKDKESKISSYEYNENKTIKLDEFLEKVTFTVSDYKNSCKEYKENSLYLLINATLSDTNTVTYKVPLKLIDTCST